MSRTTMESVVDMLSYRSLLRYAKSLSLPGNLKKCEYIEVLKLHRMGLDAECKALAYTMKTKKRGTVIKSPVKNVQKKSSAGRPRKLMSKIESLPNTPSKLQTKYIEMAETTVENFQTNQSLMPGLTISEMYPSSSLQNIVCDPPISKSTSERLRSVLLSTDRSKFNQAAANSDNFFNFRLKTWTDIATANSNPFVNDTTNLDVSGNNYLLDLQSLPDIPQLADAVDIASFDLDNSKNMKDPNNRNAGLFDDSDTLSSQSAADSTEREQRDIDRRLVMSIRTENTITSSEFMKCDALNPLDDGSLLGPQDTARVQNDVIQNYIDKNNVQFMQLPDSSCEVIQTLEFYESNNVNESMPNDHVIQDEQFNVAETNNTLAEFANMLPCPIAGCNWHSHSATLYVHLSTCHQQMIFYGNSITHVFRCQDIRNFGFFTHLQFVQNTMYIITVALCSYSHNVVATIQHVSSSGDNTSVSPTTAVLTSGFLHNKNDKQHSWTGQVQPYSVPLDVLHADGKCLFIDPSDVEQRVVVHVNLTGPFLFPGNPLLTCL